MYVASYGSHTTDLLSEGDRLTRTNGFLGTPGGPRTGDPRRRRSNEGRVKPPAPHSIVGWRPSFHPPFLMPRLRPRRTAPTCSSLARAVRSGASRVAVHVVAMRAVGQRDLDPYHGVRKRLDDPESRRVSSRERRQLNE